MQEQAERSLAPARQRRRFLRWGRVRHEGWWVCAQSSWRWCTFRLSTLWLKVFRLGGSHAEKAGGEGGEHSCRSHPGSRGHAFQRPRSLITLSLKGTSALQPTRKQWYTQLVGPISWITGLNERTRYLS